MIVPYQLWQRKMPQSPPIDLRSHPNSPFPPKPLRIRRALPSQNTVDGPIRATVADAIDHHHSTTLPYRLTSPVRPAGSPHPAGPSYVHPLDLLRAIESTAA